MITASHSKEGTEPSISVRIILFAAYREVIGERILTVQIGKDATPEDVFLRLQKLHPELSPLRSSTTFAVNRTVVLATHRLQDDDELAFLQPVSGGECD